MPKSKGGGASRLQEKDAAEYLQGGISPGMRKPCWLASKAWSSQPLQAFPQVTDSLYGFSIMVPLPMT
ncbi:hypothetical protein GMSM_43460 [Geomonas sp. Red276]